MPEQHARTFLVMGAALVGFLWGSFDQGLQYGLGLGLFEAIWIWLLIWLCRWIDWCIEERVVPAFRWLAGAIRGTNEEKHNEP